VSAKLVVGAGVGAVLGIVVMLGASLGAVAAVLHLLNPFSAADDTGAGPATAITDIPADYLRLYVDAAATCPGLAWSVLAGVGKIETDHGRSTLPGVHSGSNTAGARGPMQFLALTFESVTARHPIPPGGATPPSPYNPHDAIYAAAAYLCDSGANHGDLNSALFAYNHAHWYVNEVLALAHRYAAQAGTATTTPSHPPPAPEGGAEGAHTGPSGATPSGAVRAAIVYARAQLGRPYHWGDNAPAGADSGFDGSGLVKAAYAAAGITLPRTAEQQFHAGPILAHDQDLVPGDLVFYRGATSTGIGAITHVALYIGGGQIIHAAHQNEPVALAVLPRLGYAGASRPTSARSTPGPAMDSLVPPATRHPPATTRPTSGTHRTHTATHHTRNDITRTALSGQLAAMMSHSGSWTWTRAPPGFIKIRNATRLVTLPQKLRRSGEESGIPPRNVLHAECSGYQSRRPHYEPSRPHLHTTQRPQRITNGHHHTR
jgi:cell wall-associated NlpC family hydrolase